MKGRILRKFEELKRAHQRAFVPYVCCGDPSPEFTKRLVHGLQDAGADLLELGIPFSDTLADGQTIQSASERAIKGGMNVEKALALVKELREEGVAIPILPMTYYNLVFHFGVENFCSAATEAGADGLLIPDVPFEESGRLKKACENSGLDLIYFVSPTTGEKRMRKILGVASGFVYAVAVLGVTGARESFEQEASGLVSAVKRLSSIPVAAGFGISKPEHAAAAARAGADAIVEGSQLVKIYSKFLVSSSISKSQAETALQEITVHVKEMKSAMTIVRR